MMFPPLQEEIGYRQFMVSTLNDPRLLCETLFLLYFLKNKLSKSLNSRDSK